MKIIQNPNSCPTDMILEVLSRVSFEALQRCWLVSEEWNRLTHESSFLHLHYEKTGTIYGHVIHIIDYKKHYTFFACYGNSHPVRSLSFNFLPEEVKIEAMSNQGLVYCVTSPAKYSKPYHYVCKPTTREWIKIPNPKTKFETYANAMVVLQFKQSMCYKIVRFSKPITYSRRYFIMLCEIFDSTKGVWKQSEIVKLPYFMFLEKNRPIYFNGVFHWMTNNNGIFAFNVNNEKWNLIPLPEEVLDADGNHFLSKKLVQYEGKLGLILNYENDDKVEIWVMENYTRRIWTMKQRVKSEKAVDIYSSDTLALTRYDTLVWYNFYNEESTTIMVGKIFLSHEVFPFQSDWEPVFQLS